MHQHLSLSFAATAALALTTPFAIAQSYVVSPSACTVHEGGSNNNFPFQSTFRYQQVHGDLKGTARSFKGLAWRRDGTTTTTQPARTQNIELWMGDGDFAMLSTTFASNYVNTPVQVFTPKNVNLPDHTARADFQPAPWDVNLAFDTPYSYAGIKDITYEVVIHTSSIASTSYVCDAYSGTTLTAGFTTSGTGCTTANGVMKLRTNINSSTSTNAWTVSWSVSGAPSSATTAIMTGFTNPNAPIFGLCSGANLYTDALLFTLTATSTTTGTLTQPSPALSLPFDPYLVGFTVHAQAASIDNTQTGLPVAASNGNTASLPPLMPVPAVQIGRVYASGTPTATTGSMSNASGLVTRFQY
jgi:hypothetical protein